MSRTLFLSKSLRWYSVSQGNSGQLARKSASQAYDATHVHAAVLSCPSCIAGSKRRRAPAVNVALSSSAARGESLFQESFEKRSLGMLCRRPQPLKTSPAQEENISDCRYNFKRAARLPCLSRHGVHSRAPICRASGEQGDGPVKSVEGKRLFLYSKPGCHLCDGLKEKLDMAFMLGGEHSIAGVKLEIRNILDKEEWKQAHQYEIPVLTWSKEGSGDEVPIPRFSPRTSIERIQKQLHSTLTS